MPRPTHSAAWDAAQDEELAWESVAREAEHVGADLATVALIHGDGDALRALQWLHEGWRSAPDARERAAQAVATDHLVGRLSSVERAVWQRVRATRGTVAVTALDLLTDAVAAKHGRRAVRPVAVAA